MQQHVRKKQEKQEASNFYFPHLLWKPKEMQLMLQLAIFSTKTGQNKISL